MINNDGILCVIFFTCSNKKNGVGKDVWISWFETFAHSLHYNREFGFHNTQEVIPRQCFIIYSSSFTVRPLARYLDMALACFLDTARFSIQRISLISILIRLRLVKVLLDVPQHVLFTGTDRFSSSVSSEWGGTEKGGGFGSKKVRKREKYGKK